VVVAAVDVRCCRQRRRHGRMDSVWCERQGQGRTMVSRPLLLSQQLSAPNNIPRVLLPRASSLRGYEICRCYRYCTLILVVVVSSVVMADDTDARVVQWYSSSRQQQQRQHRRCVDNSEQQKRWERIKVVVSCRATRVLAHTYISLFITPAHTHQTPSGDRVPSSITPNKDSCDLISEEYMIELEIETSGLIKCLACSVVQRNRHAFPLKKESSSVV
jgi:hypothetical protein